MEWENKVICVHNFIEIQALFNHTYFSWTSWRTGGYGLPCHFLSKSGLIMGSIVARLHPASLRQLITFVLLGWVLNTKWFFSLDRNIFLSNSDVIVLIWKRGSICLLIWPCVWLNNLCQEEWVGGREKWYCLTLKACLETGVCWRSHMYQGWSESAKMKVWYVCIKRR